MTNIFSESTECEKPKNKKQSAVIHWQKMQICRLLKKLEKLKVRGQNCEKCTMPSGIVKNASKYLSATALNFLKTQLQTPIL